MIYDDCMYIVVGNKALAIDYNGTAISADIIQDDDVEYVDWDSADPIDWIDLQPIQYQCYKSCIDFLHQFANQPEVFTK